MTWLGSILTRLRQFQEASREREPIAGKTTKRSAPRNVGVERGVRIEYRPDLDGDADPGEVVWTWVPFQEDPSKGKDRPVVVIGRTHDADGDRMLAAVPLTSRNKGRSEHVPVGTGAWDPKRRPSWARADRLLCIDPDDVRREGAILSKERFDDVVGAVGRYHELVRV